MKAMFPLALVLFTILSGTVLGQECQEGGSGSSDECKASPTENDDKCPDRGHITRCAGAFLDINRKFSINNSTLYNVLTKWSTVRERKAG
jgi:hypothetical protein